MGCHDEIPIRHGNHWMQFPKWLWNLVLRQERNDQPGAHWWEEVGLDVQAMNAIDQINVKARHSEHAVLGER